MVMPAAAASASSLDLYITANSPGEIAGWVTPVVRELRVRVPDCRVTLVIVPCPYASGAEISYGADVEGVDRCIRIGGVGRALRGEASGDRKLVLHLGGDYFFSVYLSRRLRSPIWGYARRPRMARYVERFFVPDAASEGQFESRGFPRERYERIGHLALDSVVLRETESQTRQALGLTPDEPVVACLSGSRPIEYGEGVPLFSRIASMILDRFPDHRFFFPLAPTVDEELLQKKLNEAGISWFGNERVRAVDLGKGRKGMIVRDKTLEVLNCSKFAIAVPGTNNLQAAALYVPFLMVLPLDRAEEIPLDGLPGILPLWLPGVRRFKRNFIMRLNEKTPYLTLPSRMAGRLVAPEIRGIFKAEDVAERAIELLGSPERLQEISRAFWELTHERGAAAKMAERIAEWTKR